MISPVLVAGMMTFGMAIRTPSDGCPGCTFQYDNCASYVDSDGCVHTSCHAPDGRVQVRYACSGNKWNLQTYGGGGCAQFIDCDNGTIIITSDCNGATDRVRRR